MFPSELKKRRIHVPTQFEVNNLRRTTRASKKLNFTSYLSNLYRKARNNNFKHEFFLSSRRLHLPRAKPMEQNEKLMLNM